ncbi:MAG: DedA family protein [Micromonosporaceae bacterium]|nr:DedA family protein [Micromonosporaceae bacterium]
MRRVAVRAQPKAQSGDGPGGLTGWVIDVVDALGEFGIAVLTLLETVFPPIPSEVVLPLAGYLASRGRLHLVGVLLASVAGALAGALVLYGLAARLGERRATALLARLPLIDTEDVTRAAGWFHRHDGTAVFTGRLVPGVRSLISLPAGAARMPLLLFTVLTLLGSAMWNSLLIAGGYLLGTQYAVIERYSTVLDYTVAGAAVLAVALLVRRRWRKRKRAASRD